tara:strand:+ start:2044 stop:2931 length:888 start_codon:yes stop_codon:yes gene_type:complete
MQGRDDEQDLSKHVTRTARNDWMSEIEATIVDRSPYPTTYDVGVVQSTNFTEFTYTEFLGGALLRSQNSEINARIMEDAAAVDTEVNRLDMLSSTLVDKYELGRFEGFKGDFPKSIYLPPGGNVMWMVDQNKVAQAMFEDDSMMIKPHPLTTPEDIGMFKGMFGATRIIDIDVSGVALLKNCEVAGVTSASELCAMAVLFGKDIKNFGAYTAESAGCYFSINRQLFAAKNQKTRLRRMNNMIENKASGIIFPWMDDINERIDAFNEAAIKMKNTLRPTIHYSVMPNCGCKGGNKK